MRTSLCTCSPGPASAARCLRLPSPRGPRPRLCWCGSAPYPSALPPALSEPKRLASRPARGVPRATGPFPCPGLSLCPRGPGTLSRHHTWGPVCPSSTLLKPTGETVVRSRLCVVTSLCPGAECSPRPWWEEDPCLGARRSSCQAGGAGRGVPPSLSPALLGRCPSHPDRLQWWVTGSASPAQLQRQVLGRARPSSQPGAPEVRDGAQHPLPRGECYCAG